MRPLASGSAGTWSGGRAGAAPRPPPVRRPRRGRRSVANNIPCSLAPMGQPPAQLLLCPEYQRRHVVPFQVQLPRDFVIAQFAVIAQDQRHPIIVRQACDGVPHLRPLFLADDGPQRRGLRTGRFDDGSFVFNFHNHPPTPLPAPQGVNALVASYPQQPPGERYRTVIALDGVLQLEEYFAGGILRALPRVQHVTAQSE